MILYLVNQHGRVFQTDSYRNSFGFYLYAVIIQPLIYIPCGMPGSQNDRPFESLSGICLYTCDFVFFYDKGVHSCFEVHFTATFYDGIPHVFNHAWQFVRTDVRMGIYQDGGTGPMLAEYIQNFVHIPPFLASGVEFAVRIGSCATFSETVVAFGIHFVLTADTGDIYFSITYIFPSFHYDRSES